MDGAAISKRPMICKTPKTNANRRKTNGTRSRSSGCEKKLETNNELKEKSSEPLRIDNEIGWVDEGGLQWSKNQCPAAKATDDHPSSKTNMFRKPLEKMKNSYKEES